MQNPRKRIAMIMIYFMVAIPALLACNLLTMLDPSSDDSSSALPDEEVQAIVTEYQTWTRLNNEPINVSAELWALCRLPSTEEQAYLDSPHAEYYINVYVNELGRDLITKEGPRNFKAGTVILKEKLATLEGEARNELGIMVKDGPSSWRYLYWDDGTAYQAPDEVGHCAECHSAETEGDSVFWPLSPE